MFQVNDSYIFKFLKKIEIDQNTGCWNWVGAIWQGYGRVAFQGKNLTAYNVSLLLFKKIPLTRGPNIHTDHLCRNRKCVNPQHLELVTGKVNVLRGVSPPALNSKKTHCPKGHALNFENTYIYPTGNRSCRTCRRDNEKARVLRLKLLKDTGSP